MPPKKRTLLGLEALYFTGAHKLMQPLVGGVGAILTLHHVWPARSDEFQPNRSLEITPDFLKKTLQRLRQSGFDVVSLDEMHRRLIECDFRRRFVALTFDDGYRDNKTWAYPILKEHNVPFVIYVTTGFADRSAELWWKALERIIAVNDTITLDMGGIPSHLRCGALSEKYAVYEHIFRWLRGRPSECEMRVAVHDLVTRYSVDLVEICEALCMSLDEIRELAEDPLVTIGVHTVNHPVLARASDSVVHSEFVRARTILEAALGRAVRHLAYPYGDASSTGPREFAIAKDVGFVTAVTTQPGMLFAHHRLHLMALPRISLSGDLQCERYVDVFLSGAATALWSNFRRMVSA